MIAEDIALGNPLVGERLDRMIEGAGLDRDWVMEIIQEYHGGNNHNGQWQRYVDGLCWKDLAKKLCMDSQQLEKINSTDNPSNRRRRCMIMRNIRNTQRLYFHRLDGAEDFELSQRALRLEEEFDDSSSDSYQTLQQFLHRPLNNDMASDSQLGFWRDDEID